MALTDRRVLFFAAAGGEDADAGGIDYHDLATVDVDDGSLHLSTTDGVEWAMPTVEGPTDAVEGFECDLAWIGDLRRRLLAMDEDLEVAASEIRDHAASAEWEAAEETYGRVRRRLDSLVGDVQRTAPVADDALAPELTGLERSLESAYVDLQIERAESRLALARQLVEEGDHERMASVLEEVREDHRRASAHAEALERGDAFRFGQQRSAREKIERLEWEIDAVAAEPLQEAHEAKLLAELSEDADEQVDNWERTFRRFSAVLDLLQEDDRFAGESDDVREEVRTAARRLLEIHRSLARSQLDGEDDIEGDALATAIDHVERAHELAEEYHPDAAPDLASRLEDLRAERDGQDGAGASEADDGSEEPTEDFYRGGSRSAGERGRGERPELVVGFDPDGSD